MAVHMWVDFMMEIIDVFWENARNAFKQKTKFHLKGEKVINKKKT